MSSIICRWPVRWASIIALTALSMTMARAQSSVHSPPSQGLERSYRSVFEGYQKFEDQPLTSWGQAHATVQKNGGWRVYAKEARQPDSSENMDKTPMPNPKSGAHDAHGGKP